MNAQTSINKNRLPKAYTLITENKDVQNVVDWKGTQAVQDHGCGRYVRHIHEKIHRNLKHWYGWDKHHENTMDWLKLNSAEWIGRTPIARHISEEKTLHVSSNVMNVITDDWELFDYCNTIYNNMNVGEYLLITVYEAPKPSSSQRAEPLALYVEKLESYYGLITVRQTKGYAILVKD